MLSWLGRNGEHREWTTQVFQGLDDVFPFPEHNNTEEWIRYLPHTQHVLQLRKRTDDEEAPPSLLFKVGESFQMLGKHEEAEQVDHASQRRRVIGPKLGLLSLHHLLLQFLDL